MPAPYSTLQTIYTKVRRLTRSPSTAQLTNDDINDYVNTFVLYDFPNHLRLFDLREEFVFYTQPYVDTYSTVDVPNTSPFYNFRNRYVSIHEPLYIAGFRRFYSQSREQFFGLYPQIQSIQSVLQLGDGVTMQYQGRIPVMVPPLPLIPNNPGSSLLRNQVQFNSIAVNNVGLIKSDVPFGTTSPFFPTYGNLVTPDVPPVAGLDPNNFINYVTGDFVVTFDAPPAPGVRINSQTVPTVVAMPQAVLFFDDIFTVRPVPDQVYKISFEVYVTPNELLSTAPTSHSKLHQWWTYIAYGAVLKIFQDRMDMESINNIMPEFKKQEMLVQRKTIVELTNQRTSTIFTEGNANWPYGGWGNFSGGY